MAKSQFYKAAEKVQGINLAKIELETLTQMTIRELRGVVAKINHEAKGLVFCKATLGKPVSYFKKNELLNIIWAHLTLKRYAPKSVKWEIVPLTPNNRIIAAKPSATQKPWTVNLGFLTLVEAEKLQKYLHKKGLCSASVVRPGKRTGYKYELKVWELESGSLQTLIEKEQHRLRLVACA